MAVEIGRLGFKMTAGEAVPRRPLAANVDRRCLTSAVARMTTHRALARVKVHVLARAGVVCMGHRWDIATRDSCGRTQLSGVVMEKNCTERSNVGKWQMN